MTSIARFLGDTVEITSLPARVLPSPSFPRPSLAALTSHVPFPHRHHDLDCRDAPHRLYRHAVFAPSADALPCNFDRPGCHEQESAKIKPPTQGSSFAMACMGQGRLTARAAPVLASLGRCAPLSTLLLDLDYARLRIHYLPSDSPPAFRCLPSQPYPPDCLRFRCRLHQRGLDGSQDPDGRVQPLREGARTPGPAR